jgi:hypothetical protein
MDVSTETIETPPSADGFFMSYLKNKYAGRPISVIVAVGSPAVDFAWRNRGMFGNPPIVATLQAEGRIDRALDVTGLRAGPVVAINGMIDLALALRPDACCVAVIDGTRDNDGGVETAVRRRWNETHPRIRLDYLRDLPLGVVLSRVTTLPDRALVVFARQTIRTASTDMNQFEALAQVVNAARLPVFSAIDDFVGRGIVGGYMWSDEGNAARMAAMARAIANGARARDVPVEQARYVKVVDWRQLERWRIPEARLPAGTVVRFRPQTFFDLYWPYVVGAVLIFVGQLASIVALVVQRIRRRRPE